MDQDKLESLAVAIDEIDEAVTPKTPEQIAQAEADAKAADPDVQAKSWGMMAYTIGGMLALLAPELKAVYTEDACLAWGTAMVPVAEKYGWDGPSNVPELGLVMATLPLALPSYLLIRQRIAALKAAKEAHDQARTVENGAAPTPAGAGA